MKNKLYITLLMLFISCGIFADNSAKQAALDNLRINFPKTLPFRGHVRTQAEKLNYDSVVKSLQDDGRFSDLITLEEKAVSHKDTTDFTTKAFRRIWTIAEEFRTKKISDQVLEDKLFKSIVHYGQKENNRKNQFTGRWTQSCFDIPTAAINIFFSFAPKFFDYEKKPANSDDLTKKAYEILQKLAMQAWTVPARGDETDKNVVSVERFRNNTLWVGGNAISYRPTLQSAILLNSIPMMDVMEQVMKNGISEVSVADFDNAFWSEGFTSDGSGWGHGRQCYVWGYPIDGAFAVANNLVTLKNTPWGAQLERKQIDTILNYLRGSAFYYYKGFEPPVSGRELFLKKKQNSAVLRAASLANLYLKNYADSFTKEEVDELKQYLNEANNKNLFMLNQPKGFYHGSRYFFDNDDMIHKNPDYYIMVNMASNRVDGVESATKMADSYNIFTADGATLFQRSGDEYRKIFGALNPYYYPGVTTRASTEKLTPVNNWRGYNSEFDFAAGATLGKDFVAGFIYRKNDAAQKTFKPEIWAKIKENNPFIYGVLAYKSYFLFGNTFLALGAGITNEKSEFDGSIVTTMDQTLLADDSLKIGEWERNNGFFYKIIPEYTTGKPVVKREKRKTNWKDMNAQNNIPDEEVEIFEISIDHGKNITNGTYAYVVECSGEVPQKLPEILENSTKIQAAQSPDGLTIGAIFFDSSATLNSSLGKIMVDKPCALLVTTENGKLIYKTFDASGKAKEVKVNITR